MFPPMTFNLFTSTSVSWGEGRGNGMFVTHCIILISLYECHYNFRHLLLFLKQTDYYPTIAYLILDFLVVIKCVGVTVVICITICFGFIQVDVWDTMKMVKRV